MSKCVDRWEGGTKKDSFIGGTGNARNTKMVSAFRLSAGVLCCHVKFAAQLLLLPCPEKFYVTTHSRGRVDVL